MKTSPIDRCCVHEMDKQNRTVIMGYDFATKDIMYILVILSFNLSRKSAVFESSFTLCTLHFQCEIMCENVIREAGKFNKITPGAKNGATSAKSAFPPSHLGTSRNDVQHHRNVDYGESALFICSSEFFLFDNFPTFQLCFSCP